MVHADSFSLSSTRDVLQRHFRACKVRLQTGLDIPALSRNPRGKRRKACDYCNMQKRACSSTQPCETCARRNEDCTYTYTQSTTPSDGEPTETSQDRQYGSDFASGSASLGLRHGISSQLRRPRVRSSVSAVSTASDGTGWTDWTDWADSTDSTDWADWASDDLFQAQSAEQLQIDSFDSSSFASGLFSLPSASTEIKPGITFQYMKRFTQCSGLVNSFECGALSERQRVIAREDGPAGGTAMATGAHTLPRTLDLSISVPGDWPTQEDTRAMTASIVSMFRDVTLNKSRGSKISICWSPSVEASCYRFFSGPDLARNLALFWSSWHPNCPILHKPTFSVAGSSPGLIASMAIIGACLSPCHSDRATARILFDSLEELVFLDDVLLDDSVSILDGADHKIRRRLQAIQAAYFVCVIQNWEGCKASSKRIRNYRYAVLLAVSSSLREKRKSHADSALTD